MNLTLSAMVGSPEKGVLFPLLAADVELTLSSAAMILSTEEMGRVETNAIGLGMYRPYVRDGDDDGLNTTKTTARSHYPF